MSHIEDGYMVESKEYEDRPLCREDVLEMAKKYIDDQENEYDSCPSFAVPLFGIMKTYFAMNDDDRIICHSE